MEYIRNAIIDTEAAVVATDDAVIVAFRGTETNFSDPTNIIDVVVDLALQPVGGVHGGFLLAAASTLGDVEAAIATQPGKHVWLTGHSLGGALATVTAGLLQSRLEPVHVRGVSTYGAPRVFLEAVADLYDAGFSDRPTQRWVNNLDPHSARPALDPPAAPVHASRAGRQHRGRRGKLHGRSGRQRAEPGSRRRRHPPAHRRALGRPGTERRPGRGGRVRRHRPRVSVRGRLRRSRHDPLRGARIFAHLPADLQALVPIPPYPANPQTSCDVGDAPPPVVTPTVTGTLGNNGWYRCDVSVSWTVTDDGSAVSSSACDTTVVQTDTSGLTLTCTATSAGG